MQPADVAFLRSDLGRALLREARRLRDRPAHLRPGALQKRAAGACPDPGRAARLVLAQDDLRVRAAARMPRAEELLLDADGLAQASAWPVARDRAARWPGDPDAVLTDLTAGLGFDALAAATSGRPVRAYERDPLRAALLVANAAALGLADRLEVLAGDVVTAAPTGPVAFLDPARRGGGRRTRDTTRFGPPAETWLELLGRFDAAEVKLAPARPPPPLADHPFEIVSLAGRARETRVLVGRWGTPPARCARALPSGATVTGTGRAWPDPAPVGPGDWLLDPDVSVVLAGLVGDLARDEGLAPIHPRVAYLTGPGRTPTEAGAWMQVDAVLPARAREIDRWLAAAGVGNLTIRTRATNDAVEVWRKRLHPRGPRAGTLVVTRGRDDRWVAYACLG